LALERERVREREGERWAAMGKSEEIEPLPATPYTAE
jgi:hypothetical protein